MESGGQIDSRLGYTIMNMDSSVAVEAPESEEREEVAKDVCSLTLKHSDSRLIVPAETRSLYARCLMGNYGRWAEEVGSGEVRSTTLLPLPRDQHPRAY